MFDVEVHFTAHIPEEYRKKLLARASEEGFDHSDAGPMLTIRRLLENEGLVVLDELHDASHPFTVTNHRDK